MIRDETGKTGREPKDSKLIMVLDVLGHFIPVHYAVMPLYWGMFDLPTRRLYLSPENPGGPLAELETAVHEVFHAIEVIGLARDDRMAERQVNLLALGFVNVLHRNPQFRKLLWDKLEVVDKLLHPDDEKGETK